MPVDQKHVQLPVLTTERLTLRSLLPSDAEAICTLRSDAIVNRFIDRPKQITIEEAAGFIIKISHNIARGHSLYWGISLLSYPEIIGTICLWNFSPDGTSAEIGFELMPEHHRKGLMKEAVKKVLTFAFGELNLSSVEAYTHPDNVASIHLLTHFGFARSDKKTDDGNMEYTVFYLRSC